MNMYLFLIFYSIHILYFGLLFNVLHSSMMNSKLLTNNNYQYECIQPKGSKPITIDS